jgi:hypothetical protein
MRVINRKEGLIYLADDDLARGLFIHNNIHPAMGDAWCVISREGRYKGSTNTFSQRIERARCTQFHISHNYQS